MHCWQSRVLALKRQRLRHRSLRLLLLLLLRLLQHRRRSQYRQPLQPRQRRQHRQLNPHRLQQRQWLLRLLWQQRL